MQRLQRPGRVPTALFLEVVCSFEAACSHAASSTAEKATKTTSIMSKPMEKSRKNNGFWEMALLSQSTKGYSDIGQALAVRVTTSMSPPISCAWEERTAGTWITLD